MLRPAQINTIMSRRLITVLALAAGAAAVPSKVTCNMPVEVNAPLMGDFPAQAIEDGATQNFASVKITRGSDGSAVSCGADYVPGEELEVELIPSGESDTWRWLWDLSGGAFVDGSCGGRRKEGALGYSDAATTATLVAPASGPLRLRAGFAKTYVRGVELVPSTARRRVREYFSGHER